MEHPKTIPFEEYICFEDGVSFNADLELLERPFVALFHILTNTFRAQKHDGQKDLQHLQHAYIKMVLPEI